VVTMRMRDPRPSNRTKVERFPDLLGLLSARFAKISHVEIDAEIEGWLERVGRSLDLDRTVIGAYLPENGDFRTAYQWTREGFPRGPIVAASEVIPWIASRVRAGKIVAISGVDALPLEAERDRDFMLSSVGPKATLDMPLMIGGRVVAGITFEDLHGERRWPPTLVRRLRLVTDIFANAFERRRSALETDRLVDEARQAARATLLGEIAAVMAHELSHPLGAILANAQAARRLLEGPRPNLAELMATLEDVISSERRAAAYIEKIRSLFKKAPLHVESLLVDRIFSVAAALMQSELLSKGVSLQMQIEPNLPTIAADRIAIEQVMINLIRNAADAACEGENSARTVTLRASQQDPLRVMIAVSDTGRGVDREHLGKIFQPLFTTKTNGMGMGLAIVRSIVGSHGAEIHVRSATGTGATFEFALPVAGET
jgi:signal transduction histidine kinase